MHIHGVDGGLHLEQRQALQVGEICPRPYGKLFGNGLGALEGLSLKGEHGLLLVERTETPAVGGECLVVEAHKVVGHGVNVDARHGPEPGCPEEGL